MNFPCHKKHFHQVSLSSGVRTLHFAKALGKTASVLHLSAEYISNYTIPKAIPENELVSSSARLVSSEPGPSGPVDEFGRSLSRSPLI